MIYILFILVGLVVAFLAYVAVSPSDFRVERSRVIPASPEKLFSKINDLKAWEQWSPWDKDDPQIAYEYEGPRTGEGAIARWQGNNKAGAGDMKIINSEPEKRVEVALNFIRPFKASNTAEFTLEPIDDGHTRVVWALYGKNNFLFKAVGVFISTDKMCGDQFVRGLKNLENVVAG